MLAVAAVVVGLIVVGTTAIAAYTRNKEKRTSSAAKAGQQEEGNMEPSADTSTANKDRSVVMEKFQVRSFPVHLSFDHRVLCAVVWRGVCGGFLFFFALSTRYQVIGYETTGFVVRDSR